jgi:hypothetical protein
MMLLMWTQGNAILAPPEQSHGEVILKGQEPALD